MPRTYKPVPWHLRKRRPKGAMPRIEEVQYLTDGMTIKNSFTEDTPKDDGLGDWIDENWGTKEPKKEEEKPRPPGPAENDDLRYYVSATQGSTGWNPAFEGFGVFDAQNHEYCVYASYTLAHAERRCKLMNDVDQGLRHRYEVLPDPHKKLWHVVDIYHEMRWAWTGSKEECEALAAKLNGGKT